MSRRNKERLVVLRGSFHARAILLPALFSGIPKAPPTSPLLELFDIYTRDRRKEPENDFL